ncbi:NAD-dependent epimerase/dehydratase family protein [Microlunatus sp. GCM10028923]|uniref:NAD-dependent epimerase/dehydratase family protein n=1 Tax=Microlunatus sp. GCM10028923 TaxID=3273400 RepID=UPI00361F489E
MTKILYTGGAGRMGRVIRERLEGRYDEVVLYSRRPHDSDLLTGESGVVGGLDDLEALTQAAKGVDVIIHLAAATDEAGYSDIERDNMHGTYNVYEAARTAGVRRVVYASSNHAVGFYPAGQVLDEQVLPRPDTYYGLSKVFGEALARLYHDKWGIESVCLRIGTFRPEPEDVRQLALWLSWRDGAELVRCAIEATGVGYEIVYGCSANSERWWNADHGWRAIGFVPQDDAADHAAAVDRSVRPPEFQGGAWVAEDYRGGLW